MSTRNSSPQPFVHPALFYRDDAEYLAGVVPFIHAGLAADEPVTVALPTGRLALVRGELGPAADDVLLLDMTEVGRNPGRLLPGVLLPAANAHPDRPVRIVGEPTWPVRTATEYPACVVHEALINHAFTGRDVTVLCPYDTARLTEQAIADAAVTHPELIENAVTRRSDHYAPDDAIARYNVPLAPPAGGDTYIVDTPNMAGLRSVAAKFACRHDMDDDRADELVLALTELASNSIEHAHDSATVLLGVTGGRVVCQVRDTGHITDPLAGRRPVPPHHLRGRGLLLVNEVADLVRVHSVPGSTTVEIHFDLDRPAAPVTSAA